MINADLLSKKPFLGTFVLAFLILGAAVGAPFSKARGAETIKVGLILPLTGDKASVGEMERLAFSLAVEELNDRRRQAGEPAIQLIVEDETPRPEGARLAVERLIRKQKVAILSGGVSSSAAWVVAPIANRAHLPYLITSAAADKLTEQGWEYVFRLAPPSSERLGALLSFITKATRAQSALVLHDDTVSGLKDAQKALAGLKEKGLEVTGVQGFQRKGAEHLLMLEEIKESSPDVVYLACSPEDASAIIRGAKEVGFRPGLFAAASGGFDSPDFYSEAGSAAEGFVTITLWSRAVAFEGASGLAERFAARYQKPPGQYGAQAYAAAAVIDDALRRAASTKPADLRDALAGTNLLTVLGPVRFVSYGDNTNQNRALTYVVQWIGGRLEIVWPEAYSSAEYRLSR